MNYKIISIFTSEEMHYKSRPLWEAIVNFVREQKIAARCLVSKGVAGCYESGEIATRKIEILSFNMPLHIEIVLPASELEKVLSGVIEMVTDGIVGVQDLTVHSHRTRKHLIPRQIRVMDIMTPSPKTVLPTTAVREVIRLLLSGNFNAVPVVDESHRPVGIITQGDLIKRGGMPVRLGLLEEFDTKDVEQLMGTAGSKTAQDVMTKPVVSVTEDQTLSEAVNLMLAKGLKRLPVVDAKGALKGILARLDVFRTITRESPDWGKIQGTNVAVADARLVCDIMRRDTQTVLPNAALDEVIRLIDTNDIQRLAVVDADGRLLGLIADRDLMRVLSDHKAGLWAHLVSKLSFTEAGRRNKEFVEQSRKTKASEAMKTDLVTVGEDTAIEDAIRLMTEKSLKRLPVVDAQGLFKGMVSRDSLLRAGLHAT